MAIYKDGKVMYKGQVYKTSERYWLDGMLSKYAYVWDIEKHENKVIEVGYYGIDGTNLAGMEADVDICQEVARDMIRTLKISALNSFCASVVAKKKRVEPGINAVVVRGRKVPKGTEVSVFWVGERPTYTGCGTEEIAGCKDAAGNKLWIKAEYLKVISKIKSPRPSERKKYINHYVERVAGYKAVRAARNC